MMTDDEIIDVVRARKAGKPIEFQWKLGESQSWHEADDNFPWNFLDYNYRAKPQPREFWANDYGTWFGQLHASKELARERASGTALRAIHVREVLE